MKVIEEDINNPNQEEETPVSELRVEEKKYQMIPKEGKFLRKPPKRKRDHYFSVYPWAERKVERGEHKFLDITGKERRITDKMKCFADAYLRSGGNGLAAFIESHPDSRANTQSMRIRARELLLTPVVSAYVTHQLERYGFGEKNVELQHLFLLNQFGDLRVKMSAIESFYKLQGKYKDDNPIEQELAESLNNISNVLLERENTNSGSTAPEVPTDKRTGKSDPVDGGTETDH